VAEAFRSTRKEPAIEKQKRRLGEFSAIADIHPRPLGYWPSSWGSRACMPSHFRLGIGAHTFVFCALSLCASSGFVGCAGGAGAAAQSDAKEELGKLFNLYRLYVEKNKKGPASEEALREFGKGLSAEERASRLIGDDLDGIFTSTRDNKKFVVRYNLRIDPSQNKAVAWEETGVDGRRLVALTMGYVVEYDDTMLNQAKK
jgi:hypothetical protein